MKSEIEYKPAFTTFRRTFICERLPEPLEPHDDHIQIFENYLEGTALRLRSVRHPATDSREKMIEHIVEGPEGGCLRLDTRRIRIEESEYRALSSLRGREIRKNRYLLEDGEDDYWVDVYLGDLRGLVVASIESGEAAALEAIVEPSFSAAEITRNEFFRGRELVGKSFEDVRKEFARMQKGPRK